MPEAEESVLALLGDLVFVVQQRPGSSWSGLATQVLSHHEPPVAPDLLDSWHIALQLHCRAALRSMSEIDIDGITDGLRSIRGLGSIEEYLPIGKTSDEPVVTIDLTSAS